MGYRNLPVGGIDAAAGLAEPVRGGGQKGIPVEEVKGWTGVDHLDLLDKGNAVVIRKGEGNSSNLESLPLP